MDKFEVDTEALDETKNKYQRAVLTMESLKKSLNETLSKLKSDGWNSKAGEAYFDNFSDKWAKDLDLYISVVGVLNQMLTEASTEFQSLAEEAKKLNY